MVLPFNSLGSLISAIILGELCLQVHSNSKIINAKYARHGEFPYQISIHERVGKRLKLKCGGIVLDKYHVLTTGCCIYGKQPSDLAIVAGTRDLSVPTDPNRIIVKVENIYMHEEFDHVFYENDIALLRVAPGFPTNSPFVRPIRLHFRTPEVGDHECITTGWGKSMMIPHLLAKHHEGMLHVETMPHFDWKKCRMAYEIQQRGFLKPGMICVGSDRMEKNYCPSDSGGPLVCDGMLVGLFSWAHIHLPEVFTDVVYYRDWVTQMVTRSYQEGGMAKIPP